VLRFGHRCFNTKHAEFVSVAWLMQAKDECDRTGTCPSNLGLVCLDSDMLSTGTNTTCGCASGFVLSNEGLGCYRPEVMVRINLSLLFFLYWVEL
jgi:hypothetical protein